MCLHPNLATWLCVLPKGCGQVGMGKLALLGNLKVPRERQQRHCGAKPWLLQPLVSAVGGFARLGTTD